MLIGTRIPLRIVPSAARLHEWIGIEESLYQPERLNPELLDFVMHQVTDRDAMPFRARPQDEPLARNQVIVNSASADGAVYYVGTGLGRIVPDLHGRCPIAWFVTPESPVQTIDDLADIPIGVGHLAGSHFATLRLLGDRLPRDRIVLEPIGGSLHRLNALANREISVAALQEPAASLAEQFGLRSLATGEYKRLFWVHKDLDPHALACYFRVLRGAEARLAAKPDNYRGLWARCLPVDLIPAADFDRFGLGERLVFEPFTRSDFAATLAWLDDLALDPPIHERSYEKVTVRVPV